MICESNFQSLPSHCKVKVLDDAESDVDSKKWLQIKFQYTSCNNSIILFETCYM